MDRSCLKGGVTCRSPVCSWLQLALVVASYGALGPEGPFIAPIIRGAAGDHPPHYAHRSVLAVARTVVSRKGWGCQMNLNFARPTKISPCV
jgi:hypothetical protein